MDEIWFCAINGQIVGPVSEAELMRYLSSGKLSQDSLVWKKGMAAWTPLRAVPELTGVPAGASAFGAAHVPAYGGAMNPAARGMAQGAWAKRGPAAHAAAGLDEDPGDYPFDQCASKKTNFWAYLGCSAAIPIVMGLHILAATAFAVGPALDAALEMSDSDAMDAMNDSFEMADVATPWTVYAVHIVFGMLELALIAASLYFGISIIYRAWRAIQGHPNVEFSPTKATVFALVPLLNFYGVFVAFKQWSIYYNEIVEGFGMGDAPPVSNDLFKWTAICYAVSLIPIANIFALMAFPWLWLVSLFQMGRAANYFSERAGWA